MRFRKLIVTATLVASACAGFGAVAATSSDIQSKEVAQLTEKLKARYANTEFGSVRVTPMQGIYEVTMGKNVAYTDVNGDLFLFGHIFDMKTRKDLTADRITELNKVDFSSLPLKNAIKIVKGDGSRKFAVFSDPDCPFCKKLEHSLSGVTNYTEYVFLFPIDSLHPSATVKSESIWCAKDRAASWIDALTKNVEPAAKKCATPLPELQALGTSLGVNGTPTLIRSDGVLMAGAGETAQIESFISGAKK